MNLIVTYGFLADKKYNRIFIQLLTLYRIHKLHIICNIHKVRILQNLMKQSWLSYQALI